MTDEPEAEAPTDDPACDVVAYLRELKPYLAALEARLAQLEAPAVEIKPKAASVMQSLSGKRDPDPGAVLA